MKRILGIALLLALAAGVAAAQTAGTNTVSRNGYCFNATTGQRVDCTTGSVLTMESATWQYISAVFADSISNNSATTTRMVDSTGVFNVSAYGQLGLHIYPIVAAAAESADVFVQIRGSWQAAQDSSSRFIVLPGQSAVGVGPSSRAIFGYVGDVGTIASTGAITPTVGGSEFVVRLRSETFGSGGSKGVFIPIPTGYPYISFRFRAGNASSLVTATYRRIWMQATLVGMPR